MADLYPVSVNNAVGTQVPLAAAGTSGDVLQLAGTGRAFLMVHNAAATDLEVVLAVPGMTWNGHPCPDTVVTVPASQLVIVPVPANLYGDDEKKCPITYSSTTGVRVAAVTS